MANDTSTGDSSAHLAAGVTPSRRGLTETHPFGAGPGVVVVPVVGWESGAQPETLSCRLVGVLVLRDSAPEWVPIAGSRDEYPSADRSPAPPVAPTELLALAASMEYAGGGVVFRPVAPAGWEPVTIMAGGELRRG